MPRPRKKVSPGLKRHFRQKGHKKSLPRAIIFILLGVSLIAFPSIFKYFSNRPISTGFLPKAVETRVASSSADLGPIQIDPSLLNLKEPSQLPDRVVVPALNIDLSIIEAKVVNGYWELSETTASHGVGSANPGEKGNIVIFAHAREGLFLPLRNIKVGNTIYILTKDRWYKYSVSETKEVAPNEIQVIAPTPDETLTLYTCSGFLDSKRLIVTAKPLNT